MKFSSFAIQNSSLKCAVLSVFTFIVHLLSRLFGTVFWGHPTATIQVRRELVYDANFKHLNFGLGCGFFCL